MSKRFEAAPDLHDERISSPPSWSYDEHVVRDLEPDEDPFERAFDRARASALDGAEIEPYPRTTSGVRERLVDPRVAAERPYRMVRTVILAVALIVAVALGARVALLVRERSPDRLFQETASSK